MAEPETRWTERLPLVWRSHHEAEVDGLEAELSRVADLVHYYREDRDVERRRARRTEDYFPAWMLGAALAIGAGFGLVGGLAMTP